MVLNFIFKFRIFFHLVKCRKHFYFYARLHYWVVPNDAGDAVMQESVRNRKRVPRPAIPRPKSAENEFDGAFKSLQFSLSMAPFTRRNQEF